MTQALTNVSVAIGDLITHPANVRANSPDAYTPESIAALKATIAEHGILQPLIVQSIEGKYGVLGGGRRRAALIELVADKDNKAFTNKTKIECRAVAEDCDVTTAMSFAENLHEPMTAMEEFDAFARMLEVDKQTPEQIAVTFGATVSHVKTRLRYGLVHPTIRDAARAKDITLDAMKAFADHPSQEVQLEVYEAIKRDGDYVQAYTIRQALKTRGVQVSDALGQYVRAGYEARGGSIAADLLEDHSVLEDMAIVEEVLLTNLQTEADAKAAEFGFTWATVAPRYDHVELAAYGRVYPEPVTPSKKVQKRLDAIDAEIDELNGKMDDDELSHEARDALYDQVDLLETESQSLQEAYSKDDLAKGGVHACWHNGGVMFTVGLVQREPEEATGGSESVSGGQSEPEAATDEISYSSALNDDLKTERAMALSAAMAQNPEATADLALFKLVADVLCLTTPTYAFKINADSAYRSHAKMDEIDSTSQEQLDAVKNDLDLTWAEDGKSPADQFRLFRALDPTEKAKLIAYATATTTQSCFARNRNQDALMHDFEIEVMPDIRAHWTPNAALFSRFKKAWLIKILSEDLGLTQEALQLSGSSKKEIVAFCDKLFAEPFATLTDAQREAVANWTPPKMQTTEGYSPEVAFEADEETAVADAA